MAAPLAAPPDLTPASAQGRRKPPWALLAVVLALAAVAAASVVGVIGLTGNPVKTVGRGGIATLQGAFEPYQCNLDACDGYIQAGGRSVFVQFPPGCRPPERGVQITVRGRSAPDLGTAAYRATRCA